VRQRIQQIGIDRMLRQATRSTTTIVLLKALTLLAAIG